MIYRRKQTCQNMILHACIKSLQNHKKYILMQKADMDLNIFKNMN
jgi:hypothetical protein